MGMYGGRDCDKCGQTIPDELMVQMRNEYPNSGDTLYLDVICQECAEEENNDSWTWLWEHLEEEAEREWEREYQE